MKKYQGYFRWLLGGILGIALLLGIHQYREYKLLHPDTAELLESAQKGAAFLAKLQTPEGAIADTINPLFSVWETVNAAHALHCVGGQTQALEKTLHYLQNAENPEGLLCHNLKCKAAYCVETSALYLSLLVDKKLDTLQGHRLDFLSKLQTREGYWLVGNPDVRQRQAFPSATALALFALNANTAKAADNQAAWAWLERTQNAEGHWGQHWEYYNLPAYALWAVSAAMLNNDRPQPKMQEKMIDFILKTQQRDGAWKTAVPSYFKQPSAELEAALMVRSAQALQKTSPYKKEELQKCIAKGIEYLHQQQQNNGSWEGGNFPIESYTYEKKEYVFATALAILCLHDFAEK